MIGKKINQLATELAPVSTDLTIIGDPTTGVSKKITLAQLGAIFSGAVSFYTDLASFPATGDINVIYCAKDTQKLYLWSGSAYVEVFPSQALLDTYQLRSEKGNANGYASLDSQGKVPISQLPSSIMEYKGTWNASTNTPTLANGTGDTGDVYICNVAGTVNFGAGPITFAVGDYVIYSGTIWQRSSGAVGTVTSVAASITGDSVTISGSPVTTSGTLAFAFAGNSTQYINGAGNLVTFPGVINEAQNLITEVYNKTGATLTKGTIVYINGGQGNLPAVTKALATGDSTSAQTYGIVRNDITNNNNGYVVVAGRISDLDTQAYTEGTQLYLSPTTAGTFTSTKPYAPQHLVYVGIVVRAHPTQGVVEVKIQNGYELDELHNVAAQSPSNGDILQYVSSTSLWTKVAGTTSNIAEGSNLYYTDARSRAALSFTAGSGAYNSTTGVITIPTNTNQLTNGANYITLASLSAGAGISYNNTTGVIASTITQYTDANARAAISLTTSGTSGAATYNSTTGVLNVPQYAPDLSGYVPTNRTLTINGTAFDLSANRSWSVGTVTSVGLSSATSGVTIGSTPITTNGTITLAIATASGSQQGLLSSTDWTTFNNKQNALTNPVTGTGTTNYLPKFTGTSTIGNSLLTDDGTTLNYGNNVVSIGASNTSEKYLQINSSTGILYLGGTSAEHYVYGAGSKPINFYTNGTSKMLLTASGNLGLGVTPSAWDLGKAIEIGNIGNSVWGVNATQFNILQNAYYSGGYKYASSNAASYYQQVSGAHVWYTAASGTAGNAITFTPVMGLSPSGNLSIGNTNDTYKLDVQGTGIFRTSLTVSSTTNAGLIAATNSTTGYTFVDLINNGASGKNYQIGVGGNSAASGYANNLYFDLVGVGTIMTMTSGRNVGINNNSPQNRLTVNSPARYDGGTNSLGAAVVAGAISSSPSNDFTNSTAIFRINGTDATNNLQFGVGSEAYNYHPWIQGSYDNSNPSSNDFGAKDILLQPIGGSVGIGTTSPVTKLTINNGGANTSTNYEFKNISVTSGFFSGYTANAIQSLLAGYDTNSIYGTDIGYGYDGTGYTLMFSTNDNTSGNPIERMRITSAGMIGIGNAADGTGYGLELARTSSTPRIDLVDNAVYTGQLKSNGGLVTLQNSSNNALVFGTNNAERMRITSGGDVEINTGSIKTGEPGTGWGRAAIKIGASVSGAAFNVTRYLPVSVDGTVYYINLNSSTP